MTPGAPAAHPPVEAVDSVTQIAKDSVAAYDSESGSSPGRSTATANGDLDGDGVLSTFRIDGKVDPSGALVLDPTMTRKDPDE